MVDYGGGFCAKSNGMCSGQNLIVTKPTGAGAGARSRKKRPAKDPPLLVEFSGCHRLVYVPLIMDLALSSELNFFFLVRNSGLRGELAASRLLCFLVNKS